MRWRLALVAFTVGIAMALSACGGNDDDGAVAEAFSFADDDLCEWIAADQVAGFFASVYDWDGTAQLWATSDMGPDECWWRLTSTGGSEFFQLFAGNATMGFLLPAEVVEYDPETFGAPGGTVSGHPSVSEGVVVQAAGWGFYSFWVPPGEDALAMSLTQHTSAGVTGVDSSPDDQVRTRDRARLFTLADEFLGELGWVS